MSLGEIEALVKAYAAPRRELAAKAQEIKAELRRVQEAALPELRPMVQRMAAAVAELEAALWEHQSLFVPPKPRTQVIEDIQVGFRRSARTIRFAKPETVVLLIRKHMPGQAELLINTVETPNRDALKKLTDEHLRKVGVTPVPPEDRLVIADAMAEVEKTVNGWIQDAAEREAAESSAA